MNVVKFHNWELEKAIREARLDGKVLAKKADMDPGILSNIKRGRMRPTDEEEKAIAEALGLPVRKLFVKLETA
jgi:transcriptional regulator with XRE-family HTH domain